MFFNEKNETIVVNERNETNLEYIKIIGLFDRYDVNIFFDKQVNIFIGENGLGKTTILNCIYFILEKKFSKLEDIIFSEIKVKFKNDAKEYGIYIEDVKIYNRIRRHPSYRYSDKYLYLDEMIEENLSQYLELPYNEIEDKIDIIAMDLSRAWDMPTRIIKSKIKDIVNEREKNNVKKRSGKKGRVIELIRAIDKNVSHRIIYLPTYRRIEDDFESLNIRNEELSKTEELIRFGMSDVQTSIDRILEKIRFLAMKGFTEMTGILLKQYADGKNVTEENYSREEYTNLDVEIVKIVLDRVGKEIEQSYKERVLELVSNGKIRERDYLYLWNLINKLIDNYELQKAYDDRIKKFVNTCNKYLIDKYFDYNQSTLNLDIILNEEYLEDKKRIIRLTQLSSGEKQIISLFSKLYLESDDKSIVIIDEPELSLSLRWQQMLLPDIMRTANCDLLITVTHSPFIFENEFDYDAMEMRSCIEKH